MTRAEALNRIAEVDMQTVSVSLFFLFELSSKIFNIEVVRRLFNQEDALDA